MIEIGRERRLALAMLGSLLVPAVLPLWQTTREYVGVGVVVPVLLGFGLIEIHARCGDTLRSTGRAGLLLTAVGFGLLVLTILLYAVSPPALVLAFLLALPFVAGVVALSLGSGLLALALRRTGLLSAPAAVCLGLGAPLAPLLPIALDPLLGEVAPLGLSAALASLPYAVGWLLTTRALRTADERAIDRPADGVEIGPHSLAAGVVGVVYLALGAGWLLPLGPISGTPWVGNSVVLDSFHLVAGIAGVFVGARGDDPRARTYAKVVGACSLLIVVAFPVGLAVGVWPLSLSVTGLVLYFPAGLLLAPLGFFVGVDDPSD